VGPKFVHNSSESYRTQTFSEFQLVRIFTKNYSLSIDEIRSNCGKNIQKTLKYALSVSNLSQIKCTTCGKDISKDYTYAHIVEVKPIYDLHFN